MFLVPALGVPSVLMLQDTLKSALVAAGVLVTAVLFFWQQRRRTTPLLWHGMVWLPWVLMLYALGSMVWSHTYLAAVEAVRWFVLGLLVWLGLNTVNRNNLPLLAWGIHGGVVVASLWAALQFWLAISPFPQAAVPASTFINRNFFAEYAVCALPFSVYALANMRSPRWPAWGAASVALVVVAILMTGTRSALIALLILAVAFTVILLRYRRQFSFPHWSQRDKALVGLVLAAGVIGLGSLPSGSPQMILENRGLTAIERSFLRVTSIGEKMEYTEGSFSVRTEMWMSTARMLMAQPLSGVGAGAWEVQIPLYQRTSESVETDYYAHNEFLQLLSEYGLVVGGLFLAFLFAYLLVAAGNTWRLKGVDLQEGPLRSMTLASLLALLIVSNAGFPWRLASTGALFALGMALLAGSDARLGLREKFFVSRLPWRPSLSRTLLTLSLGGVLLTGYIFQQAAEAERKFLRAIQQSVALEPLARIDSKQSESVKAQMLQSLREGIAINPHYRKFMGDAADPLVAVGDWENAIWIWESMAASRPYVAAIWANIAKGYMHLGQHERAMDAFQHVKLIQSNAPGMQALEATLLSRTGRDRQATQMVNEAYDRGLYDYALVQAGYELGLKAQNWPLAIRSLELRIRTWPVLAADSYFRLGAIYGNPALRDDAKALAAYRSGLQAVSPELQDSYRELVPARYRSKL